MMEDNQFEWEVYVRCMTYNHAPYIVDAMNGFTMQQTSFPFVCVIVDDASIDGEPDIIKKYLADHFDLNDTRTARFEETNDYVRIYTQHKINKNCFFVVILLKYNHYKRKGKQQYYTEWCDNAKYTAVCEGDDFWTSPNKLEKQIEFLNSHPTHSLCFHGNYLLYKDGTRKKWLPYKKDICECPMKDMILGGGGFMATNSMVYSTKALDDWPQWTSYSPVSDAPRMLVLAERGMVGYINEIMSCYRIASVGSWTQRQRNSRIMRKETFRKGIRTWKEFDKWSNYKYHGYVRIKMIKNAFHYLGKEILYRFGHI